VTITYRYVASRGVYTAETRLAFSGGRADLLTAEGSSVEEAKERLLWAVENVINEEEKPRLVPFDETIEIVV